MASACSDPGTEDPLLSEATSWQQRPPEGWVVSAPTPPQCPVTFEIIRCSQLGPFMFEYEN
jgi:hypothetical protein